MNMAASLTVIMFYTVVRLAHYITDNPALSACAFLVVTALYMFCHGNDGIVLHCTSVHSSTVQCASMCYRKMFTECPDTGVAVP